MVSVKEILMEYSTRKITGLELSKKGFRQDIINDAFTRSNIYKAIVHVLAYRSVYKDLF